MKEFIKKNAAEYNLMILVSLFVIAIAMFKGMLNFTGGSLDGVLFFLLIVVSIIINAILFFLFEQKKDKKNNMDHFVCGTVFLIIAVMLVLRGTGLIII